MNNILSFPEVISSQQQSPEEVDTSTNSFNGNGRLNDYLNDHLSRYSHYFYNEDSLNKHLDIQGGLAGLWLKNLYVVNYDSAALNAYSNEPFVFSRALFVPQSWIDAQINLDKNVFREIWSWADQKIKNNLRGAQKMTADSDDLWAAIEQDAPAVLSKINFQNPHDAWAIAQKEAKAFFPHLYLQKEDPLPKLVQAEVKWGVHEFTLSPKAQSLYESLDVQNISVEDVEKIQQGLNADFFGTEVIINEVMVQLLRDYFKTINGVEQDELSNVLMESRCPTLDQSSPIFKNLKQFNSLIEKILILTSALGDRGMTDLALNQYEALFIEANPRSMRLNEKFNFAHHFAGRGGVDNQVFGEIWGRNIHFSELILKKYTETTRDSLIKSFSNYFNRNPLPLFDNAFSPNYLKNTTLVNPPVNSEKKEEDSSSSLDENPFEVILKKISSYDLLILQYDFLTLQEQYERVSRTIDAWMKAMQKQTPAQTQSDSFWSWTKNKSFSNQLDYFGSGYDVSEGESLDYYFKNFTPQIDMMGVDDLGRNPTLRFLLGHTSWMFLEEGETKTQEKEKMERTLAILVNHGAPLDMPDQLGRTIRTVIHTLGLKEAQFEEVSQKQEPMQKIKLRVV